MKFAVSIIVLTGLAFASEVASDFSAGPLDPNAAKKASDIINFLVNGRGKGQSYNKLATFVDTIGSRVSGSESLDKAVDYMIDAMKRDGLENVHGEPAVIPKWVSHFFFNFFK